MGDPARFRSASSESKPGRSSPACRPWPWQESWPSLAGRICELADGTVVSPGSLVPWLGEADLERAVCGPRGRVEVGCHSRIFTGATRRAIELRDGECYHPCCDVEAERCQADHIQPASLEGLTIQENGRMACGFHNRLRTKGPPRTG